MNNKKLLYIFISLATSFIFLILGLFALTPKDIVVNESSVGGERSADCQGSACSPAGELQVVSLLGTVKKAEGDNKKYTHLLQDDAGETIAFLSAKDDKLKLVENLKVTIVGKAKITQETPLVQVSEIKL